ncbi:cell growth-regulating nucleolar protein [Gambusia affinis]|uniref:cell growth-regulating nucleolar protein n=1 Tax=Gambusia affinis TaxID=33528 RepID=UPI001CDC385A|nr:cell growth-regulating nucleolar protein [Gambusia affinis]XP_043978738.1 cell growth-regulating nucleolar protein [Gambusia affinis]
MVFFTCNGCGESLKKAQVDKHVMKCRGCQVLSCIDCGKDFRGEDYKNHTKCISEDQKYGGKGYEAKANKGDVKQKQWLQRISEAMNKPGVSAKLRDVLYQVSGYENVPRKKAKFQNWMRSSLKISNIGLQEEVWDIIAAADNTPPATQTTKGPADMEADIQVDINGTKGQEDQSDTEEKKKKLNKRERKEARQQRNGKAPKGNEKRTTEEPEKGQTGKQKKEDRKRKQKGDEDQTENGVEEDSKKTKIDDAAESEETEDQATSHGKFNWKGNIKAVLRESPDQELSVKRLRKKVLAAYYSFAGDINFKTEDELLALFNKKITKNPKFRVLKDRVKLLK